MKKPHIVHALDGFTKLIRQVNALGAVPGHAEFFGLATLITIPSRCIKRVREFSGKLLRNSDLFDPTTVRHCLVVCAKIMCILFNETGIAKR